MISNRDVAVMEVPGRQYPVQALYVRTPEQDFLDAALLTCLQIHEEFQVEHEDDRGQHFVPILNKYSLTISFHENRQCSLTSEFTGHVLVFLPGREEIESLELLLSEALPTMGTNAGIGKDFEIRSLYAAMAPEEVLSSLHCYCVEIATINLISVDATI